MAKPELPLAAKDKSPPKEVEVAAKGPVALWSTLVIQATAAGHIGGNCARITLNGDLVEVQKNETNHYRGLHIVIIDPAAPTEKNVKFSKVFDTYNSSNAFGKFVLQDIPPGHIIVAACKDECVR